MLQCRAFQVLHHHEATSIFLVNVVNGADVGMVQHGGGARLTAKALQSQRIASDIIGKKLEGHKPAQAAVFGLVDQAHSSTAELADDAVMRDGLAN